MDIHAASREQYYRSRHQTTVPRLSHSAIQCDLQGNRSPQGIITEVTGVVIDGLNLDGWVAAIIRDAS